MQLPDLSIDEAAVLDRMRQLLAEQIAQAGGALPFDRYMESALYAPGLGYYNNGRRKFGAEGDFVTAPEVSPLFSRCLAQQVAECLQLGAGEAVLEVGAGSGRMAADMLAELETLGRLPEHYWILELSPALQELQRATLEAAVPHLRSRLRWLSRLPDRGFSGVIVANEVLDAMPVQRFRQQAQTWQELAVGIDDGGLRDQWCAPFTPGLAERLQALWPQPQCLPDGYVSELNLRLAPWLGAVAAGLQRGYLLLIDYGYSRREYYHPERSSGTLICHFRHRVVDDPYLLPGLQDITASVDFSALAEAAVETGLAVAGFTTQAHFLIDNGLERRLAETDPADVRRHLQAVQGVKRLTLPGEMGERFKVMALARDAEPVLAGFRSRDLRERL